MRNPVKVYLGAENIFTPLGVNAAENFSACLADRIGITSQQGLSINGEPVFVSRFHAPVQPPPGQSRVLQMLQHSVQDSLQQTHLSKNTERVALILSTTKGDIEQLEAGMPDASRPGKLLQELSAALGHTGLSLVLSHACISGTHALILAHDMVTHSEADHVIVTGADLASKFTVTGFQSLFALSKEPCRPFCRTRSGISLGEGAATIIVSHDAAIYKERPFQLLGGATANDAKWDPLESTCRHASLSIL